MIIAGIFWLLTAGLVVLVVARAWGAGGAHRALRSGIDAVVALAAVRALYPPPGWASWLWVVAVVAVGCGAAGLVLHQRGRWTAKHPAVTVIYAVVGAALVILLA
jgi:hypothetical protein